MYEWKTTMQNKQIYLLTTMEAEGDGWDPVKLVYLHLSLPPPSISDLLLTGPRRYIPCTFC